MKPFVALLALATRTFGQSKPIGEFAAFTDTPAEIPFRIPTISRDEGTDILTDTRTFG